MLDPRTMAKEKKQATGKEFQRSQPYSGTLVGADLQQQQESEQAEQHSKEIQTKKDELKQRRLMPRVPRLVVITDQASSVATSPEDQAAIERLKPLNGKDVMAKQIQDGRFEIELPDGNLLVSMALFKALLRPPNRETHNDIQKDFERNYGTTEAMKAKLPSQYPALAAYVQAGLVKILDSSKIFANYKESEGVDPMGEAFFKNDIQLYGGKPDEMLDSLVVDWRTPNRRVNPETGEVTSLRGYYSPQVLFMPGPGGDPEFGGVPLDVLDEAEKIATKSDMKPYSDGGVYYNSTDLFRIVLGLSSGDTRKLISPSSLPGGSLAKNKTWKPKAAGSHWLNFLLS